ncbi:MAG: 16S rRNA (guanine(527)-N(7))-methyltransferase RsmG [Dehalococcoidia bacterium]
MSDERISPIDDSRFTRFRDLLAQAPFNVTSVRDPSDIEQRHIGESLALVRALAAAGHLPSGARVIDVGSGGGLPGIPMAIARPDLAVVLLEATGKKADFLEDVAQRLHLRNVRVLAARAEEAAHQPDERERYDLATARAVAPLATLVELTLPFVRVGGALAALKGSRADEEIAAAAVAVQRCGGGLIDIRSLTAEQFTPRLVIVPKIAPSPDELPRRSGIPAKRPLR